MQKYRFFQISVLILWMKWNEIQTQSIKTIDKFCPTDDLCYICIQTCHAINNALRDFLVYRSYKGSGNKEII